MVIFKYGNQWKLVIGTHPFETTPALNNGTPQDWANKLCWTTELRILASSTYSC
jgi:hypothetical protein